MEMRKDNRTPKIPLNDGAIDEFKEIFKYTQIITDLVKNMKEDELAKALKGEGITKDLPLQHALIFCLKSIGTCIDNATERLGLKIDEMPLFCQNMFYLRNNLIHHCPATSLSNSNLDLLASISTKIGQIYKYFSLVVDNKNTAIDLGSQRYKAFLDIHELAHGLKQQYPRENRTQITQQSYLKVILFAIEGLEALTKKNGFDAEALKELPDKQYFALQNLLELIATLANPNPDQRLLSEHTRNTINSSHPSADSWLRALGNSRMEAMHNTGVILSKDMAVHIGDMIKLKNTVLLDPSFQNTLGVNLGTITPTAPPQNSTGKMIQALSPTESKNALTSSNSHLMASTPNQSLEKGSSISVLNAPPLPTISSSGLGRGEVTLPQPSSGLGRGIGHGSSNPLTTTPSSIPAPSGRGRGWATLPQPNVVGRGQGTTPPTEKPAESKDVTPQNPGRGRGRGK